MPQHTPDPPDQHRSEPRTSEPRTSEPCASEPRTSEPCASDACLEGVPSGWSEVVMRRHDLEGLPCFGLPWGFGLRAYQPGDELAWLDIHRRADAFNQFSASTFRDVFGHDEAVLAARQKYLLGPDLKPIGTATAWFDEPEDTQGTVESSSPHLGAGRAHWVAIVPEFHGRGLSKPLLATVLHTLRDLGHTRAVLSTDSRRPVAIALYRSFGFRVQRSAAPGF